MVIWSLVKKTRVEILGGFQENELCGLNRIFGLSDLQAVNAHKHTWNPTVEKHLPHLCCWRVSIFPVYLSLCTLISLSRETAFCLFSFGRRQLSIAEILRFLISLPWSTGNRLRQARANPILPCRDWIWESYHIMHLVFPKKGYNSTSRCHMLPRSNQEVNSVSFQNSSHQPDPLEQKK